MPARTPQDPSNGDVPDSVPPKDGAPRPPQPVTAGAPTTPRPPFSEAPASSSFLGRWSPQPRSPSGRIREGFMPKPSDLPSDALRHMPVVRKLANEILPWFVSAEELRKKPLYVAHKAYSWTRDTLAGLTGFGLSHPLAKVIAGEGTDLGAAISKMPVWLMILTGAAATAWVVLKAFVTKDDGEKKAMLAASCRKEFMSLNLRLRSALQHQRPLKALVAIQA